MNKVVTELSYSPSFRNVEDPLQVFEENVSDKRKKTKLIKTITEMSNDDLDIYCSSAADRNSNKI